MSNISPRVDIAFKKIFGVEENKDLLISLINSVVSKEDQVTEVTLLNPYNPKEQLSYIVKKVKTSLDRSLKKALTVLEVMNFTEGERAEYEEHLKWLRIEVNTIKKAEEKGREKGREEGIKIGEAKLIKIMIENGSSIEEISKITTLSITRINELLEIKL